MKANLCLKQQQQLCYCCRKSPLTLSASPLSLSSHAYGRSTGRGLRLDSR